LISVKYNGTRNVGSFFEFYDDFHAIICKKIGWLDGYIAKQWSIFSNSSYRLTENIYGRNFHSVRLNRRVAQVPLYSYLDTIVALKIVANLTLQLALQLVEKRWKLNKLASDFVPSCLSLSWNSDLDFLGL
jgi:hypothetical protein